MKSQVLLFAVPLKLFQLLYSSAVLALSTAQFSSSITSTFCYASQQLTRRLAAIHHHSKFTNPHLSSTIRRYTISHCNDEQAKLEDICFGEPKTLFDRMTLALLCGRPRRPQYGFCPSVRLSVRPSIQYGMSSEFENKSAEKPVFVEMFPRGKSNRCTNFQLRRLKVRVRNVGLGLGLGLRNAVYL